MNDKAKEESAATAGDVEVNVTKAVEMMMRDIDEQIPKDAPVTTIAFLAEVHYRIAAELNARAEAQRAAETEGDSDE